ncbi:DUF5050 domain-containing protein [Paenibacillus lentus]
MKKMFYYQKGLVFIGLFFVINIATLIVFDKPTNASVELNASQYAFYLNQVQGAYSEETERFFANEAVKISDAKVSLRKVSDNFYDGNIKENEFISITTPLEEILHNETGYKIIYDQYTYIREKPENRYFLYTNGWDGLLSNDSLDFLFVLLLLVLVTPVFCLEFENRMNSLILTVKKGATNSAVCKVGLVLIIVVALCLLTAALNYGFYWLKYGLENGNYPLQSLSYYATSTKNSTLFEAFMWITACKIFGSLCFAMLIMLVSVLIKKYGFTLFTCTAFILLPYFGFRMESSKYFLPGPLGFMVSTGFFRGNEYEHDIIEDQMIFEYHEVSIMMWIILFVITLCISIVMFVVIMIRNTNEWSSRKPSHKLMPFNFMLMVCISSSFLFGCTPHTSTGESNVYNFSSRQYYENDHYHFYLDESDLNDGRIVFVDKQTGEKRNFVRNPMTSLTRVESTIYGNGSYVYYMKYDSDKSGFYEQVNRLSLIEVNTDTFDEKIVFEKDFNTKKAALININKTKDKDQVFFYSISGFFLDELNIYFVGQDQIRRVNRRTGKMSIIIRFPVLKHLAFDGQTIYYVNEKSQVVKYNTTTDLEEINPDLITRFFVLTDTDLLFLNRKDQQKIYAMNLRDSTVRKITDVPVLEFHCYEQSIFYVSKDDLKQYRLELEQLPEI